MRGESRRDRWSGARSAVRSRCLHGTFAMPSRYIRDAFAMTLRNVRDACAMHSRCVCGAYAVHFAHMPGSVDLRSVTPRARSSLAIIARLQWSIRRTAAQTENGTSMCARTADRHMGSFAHRAPGPAGVCGEPDTEAAVSQRATYGTVGSVEYSKSHVEYSKSLRTLFKMCHVCAMMCHGAMMCHNVPWLWHYQQQSWYHQNILEVP